MTTKTRKTPANIIRSIPLGLIQPDPEQPRKTFDENALLELAASIRANGLLQPITVRPDGDKYIIIAGERRYRAHQIIGAEAVKAIVLDIDLDRATRLQLVENLNRADLNPAEEYQAYRRLADNGMSHSEIARVVGTGVGHINVFVDIARRGSPMLMDLLARGVVKRWTAWQVRGLSHAGQDRVLKALATKPMTKAEVAGMVAGIECQEKQGAMFEEPAPVDPARESKGKRMRKTYEQLMASVIELSQQMEREYQDDPQGFATGWGPEIHTLRAQAEAAARQLSQIKRRLDVAAGIQQSEEV